MAKKLSVFLASIAVIAVAAPSLAQAAPALTEPAGVLLKPGERIQITGSNMVVLTQSAKITCSKLSFTNEVAYNAGSTFGTYGGGSAPGTASSCLAKSSEGPTTPMKITDVTVAEFHSGSVGKGTMNIKFIADEVPYFGAKITCFFSSPNAPFTYISGTDVLKLVNADLKGEPALCEPGLFSAELTVERDGTEIPIIVD